MSKFIFGSAVHNRYMDFESIEKARNSITLQDVDMDEAHVKACGWCVGGYTNLPREKRQRIFARMQAKCRSPNPHHKYWRRLFAAYVEAKLKS